MRGWLSIVGLVLTLAIVGLVVKKQMTALRAPLPTLEAPAAASTSPAPIGVQPVPPQSPAQIQQQYKQAIEGAMQQTRPMPDDAK